MRPQRQHTLIAVGFAIVLPTLVTWIYFILFDGESPVVGIVTKSFQFAFPACWVFLWMKSTLRDTELPPPSASDNAAWSTRSSLLFGLGMGIAVVLVMAAYYRFAITGSAHTYFMEKVASRVGKLSLDNPWSYAALGVFYALAHSLLEEYYFRWFVFGQLRQLTSFFPAAIVSGLAFMAHHVIVLSVFFQLSSFHTWFLSFCIAVGGLLWAWQYERSRSLVGSWLSHMLVDAGIFMVGYHILFVALPALKYA